MSIPNTTDYQAALLNSQSSLKVPHLNGFTVEKRRNSTNPLQYAGGYACVYKLNSPSKSVALRCWHKNVDFLELHYLEIQKAIKTIDPSIRGYFCDFTYHRQGILVNGKIWPVMEMEWVEHVSLMDFLENNYQDNNKIADLAVKFLQMVCLLQSCNISHGDLSHKNVALRESDGSLCLIDYDGLYIKSNPTTSQRVHTPGFQHPRYSSEWIEKVDYFSSLVIYLSLLAIANDSTIFTDFISGNEHLLFSEEALTDLDAPVYDRLSRLPVPISSITSSIRGFLQLSGSRSVPSLSRIIPTNPQIGYVLCVSRGKRRRFDPDDELERLKRSHNTEHPSS